MELEISMFVKDIENKGFGKSSVPCNGAKTCRIIPVSYPSTFPVFFYMSNIADIDSHKRF